TKYRRRAFYEARRVEVGAILRQLCEWKGRKYNRSGSMHRSCIYVSRNTPKYSVSGFMGFLKGKSSQMIYERWANTRYKYRHREFWCRGYYVDTVGKNTKRIKNYIANQLKEDQEREQLTLDLEYPFKKGKGKN
ncbi:hypothetical protein HMPREF1021_00187, partial [Coprobacillus sp. 3_3_56FAA]